VHHADKHLQTSHLHHYWSEVTGVTQAQESDLQTPKWPWSVSYQNT